VDVNIPQARREPSAVVSATPAARRRIRRLCADGAVAFLVGSPLAPTPLLCFGLRDYLPGPHERPIGGVEGCPVYLDDRFPLSGRRLAVVLDVSSLSRMGPVDTDTDTDTDSGPALTARSIPLAAPAFAQPAAGRASM
jgi:hypothetical protein